MSILTSRPVLRWAVPAVAAVAVVGAGVAAKSMASAADPALPPRSAAQLLVDLQSAQLDAMSGTVVEKADLGLPDFTALLGQQQSADLTSLVAGKHTLKVWYSGPSSARVALVGTNSAETDVIRNGQDLWLWDSSSNTATHHKLTADEAKPGPGASGMPHALPSGLPSDLPSTPQDAANLALQALSPTTNVTTGNTARIAGRDAYELVLTPKDKSSLVGQVRLAIDAKSHVPLRVQVFAKSGDQPAFEVGFTEVSFNRPDASVFDFKPPAGAKVNEDNTKPSAKAPPQADQPKGKTTTIGEGWTAVFVARPDGGVTGNATGDDAAKAQSFLNGLPKGAGGRTLNSKLFSVLVTDDGRILVGAVTPDKLAQVAADPAAALK